MSANPAQPPRFLRALIWERDRLTAMLTAVQSAIAEYETLPPADIAALLSSSTARARQALPVPVAERPRRGIDNRMFTPARNEVIRDLYPKGIDRDIIKARCEELPGRKPIPPERIAIQAYALNVRRPTKGAASPAAVAATVLQTAATDPPPAPAPAPVSAPARAPAVQPGSKRAAAAENDPGEPQEVDFDTVATWAAPRGVTFHTWEDLPAVNRQRERHRMPLFKRRFGPALRRRT